MSKQSYYRGDTFIFPFLLQADNNEYINFESGDVLKCGITDTIDSTDYDLYKEIKVTEDTNELVIIFNSEETKVLTPGKYTIELELTRGEYVTTIYQEELTVKGDVIK